MKLVDGVSDGPELAATSMDRPDGLAGDPGQAVLADEIRGLELLLHLLEHGQNVGHLVARVEKRALEGEGR